MIDMTKLTDKKLTLNLMFYSCIQRICLKISQCYYIRNNVLVSVILRLSSFVRISLFQLNVTHREKLHQRENLCSVNRTYSTRTSHRLSVPQSLNSNKSSPDRLIVLVCDLHFVFGNATRELVSCIRKYDTDSRCFH